jgi:Zn-dependent protease with chaperone function
MILSALGTAIFIRLVVGKPQRNLSQQWQQTLLSFFFPPLLLLMTALAVLSMGYDGQMLGVQASWLGYLLAWLFIAIASFFGIKKAYQGWYTCRKVHLYPQQEVAQKQARILPILLPYSAQIGFWQPELVVSQGLLDTLDSEHLEAVLAHEQAHYDYRDTFWFFWLGWLRSFTSWLPQTEMLWQELLWLREIRADQKATQEVDSILLAESLLIFAKAPLLSPNEFCANFSCALPRNRLAERIEALLKEDMEVPNLTWAYCWSWTGIFFALLPWITVPLHYPR